MRTKQENNRETPPATRAGSGDSGRTTLANGERVDKTDPRVEAYGALDELNCHIGLLAAELAGGQAVPGELPGELHDIQARLFDVGNSIARRQQGNPRTVCAADVRRLEAAIDRMQRESGTPPAPGFILPGGCRTAAQAHVCRAVCRRAERRLCAAGTAEETPASSAGGNTAQAYMNRLSGYFYALARFLNHFHKTPERIL